MELGSQQSQKNWDSEEIILRRRRYISATEMEWKVV